MTGDWATIIFDSRTQESNASFDMKAATITASGKVWGRWSEHSSYPKRHGPTRQIPFAAEEPPEKDLDQCIFLTPFRISDLAWYKRIVLLLSISQKSGPLPLPRDGPGSTSGGNQFSSSSTQPALSQYSIMSSSAEPYDTEEVLKPHEVLAFHAFDAIAQAMPAGLLSNQRPARERFASHS
ncbi:hypothetical protein SCHPADRAFT_225831 [Schizopora paradoxa]|uniref:Uncharacterized protein n=1 Tax=Schizopora paradoxa TaxID=27342 RepID=A0A0H2RWI0_9AGAM|nr:hypothetical protein SCHPADRAFT_225831 [Schizopora paradoxa]